MSQKLNSKGTIISNLNFRFQHRDLPRLNNWKVFYENRFLQSDNSITLYVSGFLHNVKKWLSLDNTVFLNEKKAVIYVIVQYCIIFMVWVYIKIIVNVRYMKLSLRQTLVFLKEKNMQRKLVSTIIWNRTCISQLLVKCFTDWPTTTTISLCTWKRSFVLSSQLSACVTYQGRCAWFHRNFSLRFSIY